MTKKLLVVVGIFALTLALASLAEANSVTGTLTGPDPSSPITIIPLYQVRVVLQLGSTGPNIDPGMLSDINGKYATTIVLTAGNGYEFTFRKTGYKALAVGMLLPASPDPYLLDRTMSLR